MVRWSGRLRDTTMGDSSPGQRADRTDEVLSLLTHPLRRAILACLADGRETQVELSALAARVQEDEDADWDVDEVAVSLHHWHLPMLDEAGVVDYDPDESLVKYGTHPLVESLRRQ